MRTPITLVVILLGLFATTGAQAPMPNASAAGPVLAAPGAADAPPPEISPVQKLTFQNALQRMQIAELKAQLAQAEYEKARQDATATFAALQVPGYTLDAQTLTYTKAPAKEPMKK